MFKLKPFLRFCKWRFDGGWNGAFRLPVLGIVKETMKDMQTNNSKAQSILQLKQVSPPFYKINLK